MKGIRQKKTKETPKNWTNSGVMLTEEEFAKGIEKAENGPFTTVQDSMEQFEVWLKKREKK